MSSRYAPELHAQTLDARHYIILVPGDSATEWIQLDTGAVRMLIIHLADSIVLASGASISSDSLSVLVTNGIRRINPALLSTSGATSGMVLVNQSGTPAWGWPDTPDKVAAVGWLQSAIMPHNPADTTGHKHTVLWTSLDRELPLVHGTQFSAWSISVGIKYTSPSSTHNTWSAIWISSPGPGLASITAGDRLIVRLFPQIGTSTAKLLKLYRLPDGAPLYNSAYGSEVASLSVPASEFPSGVSDQCNLIFVLTYKVK